MHPMPLEAEENGKGAHVLCGYRAHLYIRVGYCKPISRLFLFITRRKWENLL